MDDLYSYERDLINKGITLICGVDEVGRGPLIGPVVTSAVILPVNYKLDGLTDSKKLSEKKRDYFYDIIMRDAISVGIGIKEAYGIKTIKINNKVIECTIPAIGVLPPFLTFAAVRAIAPVAGIPPMRAEPILAAPCAISSIFGRCFEPIIPSDTTHERSDSTAASIAIVNASGTSVFIFSNESAGIVGVGGFEDIS